MGEIRTGRIGVNPPCLLLKTGQTTQYSSKEDDGYFEKGVSKRYVALTTGQYSGTVDIILNSKTHTLSNNCVIDKRTGLLWERYAPDGDIGPDSDGKFLWLDAANDENVFAFADQANTKELGGHTDWRVPNLFEMVSLWVSENTAPCMDTTAFPSNPTNYFWCSSTNKETTTNGVKVDFNNPRVNFGIKTSAKFYGRLVRGPLGGVI